MGSNAGASRTAADGMGDPAAGRGRLLGIGGLVLANLVPAVGVLWLGWDPGNLLVAYWLENIAVGVWTIPKILTARSSDEGRTFRLRLNNTNVGDIPTPLVLPAFILNYGLFTFVHGVFVLVFASILAGQFIVSSSSLVGGVLGYLAMLVALLVAHGISYVQNWVADGERDRTGPRGAMVAPYGRLFALHIAVLGVGFVLLYTGAAGVAPTLLLVGVKAAFDAGDYIRDQRRSRSRRAAAPPG